MEIITYQAQLYLVHVHDLMDNNEHYWASFGWASNWSPAKGWHLLATGNAYVLRAHTVGTLYLMAVLYRYRPVT